MDFDFNNTIASTDPYMGSCPARLHTP
jgi:hypothetical protein